MIRFFAPAAIAALAATALAAPAEAKRAKHPWPPIPGHGLSFAHYAEEHWDDPDGLRILPKVIRQTARYRPDLVTMSADKGEDSAVETLERWHELMAHYDGKGVPYFAAVGNHDRSQAGSEGTGSTVNGGDISNYLDIFADRPYPFGDAPPIRDPRFSPDARPDSDPDGASTHYVFTYGGVRWLFLDNSCFSFINCDLHQNPPFPLGASSYDLLSAQGARAEQRGELLFVVMHMPTQDDRPGHTEPTPGPHTMGEGLVPPAQEENLLFEQTAADAGVDAVFAGHVKGQWRYEAQGVPYYVDGGAGGEVYVGPLEETGVDYGYWHGYRLLQVGRGKVKFTDTVPVFKRGGIAITGPDEVARGEAAEFSAVGQQPTVEGADVALELRDPDPARPNADNLTTPARIWTTSDRSVLRPIAAEDDDPRRNSRRQTISGRFRARCPGVARIRVKSGWENAIMRVRVTAPAMGRRTAVRPAAC